MRRIPQIALLPGGKRLHLQDGPIDLVIEEGRIAEQGTHAELLRARGHYYRLYTQQFRHELEVQYGVADENEKNEREGVGADSIMVKREKSESVAAD